MCGDDADEVIALLRRDRRRELRRSAHRASAATSCTSSTATSRAADAVDARRAAPARRGARSRVRPGLDDKVLLGWNALFLAALTEAAAALDRDDWMDGRPRERAVPPRASCAATDGRFLRSWRAPYLAYAEDYAALLEALLHARRARRRRVARRRARRRRRAAAPVPRRRRRRVLHDRPRRRAARRAARRMSSTTRRRRRTRSPPTGCCGSRALTGDDALRGSPRSRSSRCSPGRWRHTRPAFAYLLGALERYVTRADRDRDRRRPDRPAHARAARRGHAPARPRVGDAHADRRRRRRSRCSPTDRARDAPTAYVCEHYACRAAGHDRRRDCARSSTPCSLARASGQQAAT